MIEIASFEDKEFAFSKKQSKTKRIEVQYPISEDKTSVLFRENGISLNSRNILDILSYDLSAVAIDPIDNLLGEIDKLGIFTSDFFAELVNACADKIYSHPEWALLAGRVRMLQIKRVVLSKNYEDRLSLIKTHLHPEYYEFCCKHKERLENLLLHHLDWEFSIFGVETLLGSYLLKYSGHKDDTINSLIETPQMMYLRMAVYLWMEKEVDNDNLDIIFDKIQNSYEDFAFGRISLPTPALRNAGSNFPQLSSCFLIAVGDNLPSIAESWRISGLFSKYNGGLGLAYDGIRHSEVGVSGLSKGITPWLKIENEILKTVDQGTTRKGSGAVYICDWHVDIHEFIELKDPNGPPELRAKDLFYGLMISDLFMQRLRNDEMWSLFCPAKTDGLERTFGKEFENKYFDLETKGLNGQIKTGFRQVRARDLWAHILASQIKHGMPYIIYKDAVNRKSTQQNLGTIRSSNLCTEIVLFTDENEIASCNLSSIPVSKFVKKKDKEMIFDFEELGDVTRRAIRNLGQIIQRNYYPESIPQVKATNLRNRPIGLGIQDLAGCFAKLDYCWDGIRAKALNEKIARVMYYHAMDENVRMAKEFGPYDSFPGSPASRGFFQFDLWELEKLEKKGKLPQEITSQEQIDKIRNTVFSKSPPEFFPLRKQMMEHGLYFSTIFSQMPTASSAQILGNNESIEPYTQLIGSRTVLKGQFMLHVPHLINDLEEINLWNKQTLRNMLENFGSIQNYPEDTIDDPVILFRLRYIKNKYLTAFELSQKVLADLYLARARYQCQSSSNNVFMKDPTPTKLNAYHFYMWKNGAKTGMYYLRTMVGVKALCFSYDDITISSRKKDETQEQTCIGCSS